MKKNNMEYFHLTRRENIESILTNGLKPRCQLKSYTSSFHEAEFGFNPGDSRFVYVFGDLDTLNRNLGISQEPSLYKFLRIVTYENKFTIDYDQLLWIVRAPLGYVQKIFSKLGIPRVDVETKEEALQFYFRLFKIYYKGSMNENSIIKKMDSIPLHWWEKIFNSYRTKEIIHPSKIELINDL